MTCVVSPHQRAVSLICISSTPALWPWQLVVQLHCIRQKLTLYFYSPEKNLALIPDSISMGNSPSWEIASVMFSYHKQHSAVISAAQGKPGFQAKSHQTQVVSCVRCLDAKRQDTVGCSDGKSATTCLNNITLKWTQRLVCMQTSVLSCSLKESIMYFNETY